MVDGIYKGVLFASNEGKSKFMKLIKIIVYAVLPVYIIAKVRWLTKLTAHKTDISADDT